MASRERALFVLALAVAVVSPIGSDGIKRSSAAEPCRRIIAYLPSWKANESGMRVLRSAAPFLTHVIYAFGAVDEKGTAQLGDPCLDAGLCQSRSQGKVGGAFARLARLKREFPELKLSIALGGWTGSRYFSNAALTAASRTRFADSVIDVFLRRYDGLFDGVDIDWEFPVAGGLPTNVQRPEDRDNFSLLLSEIRNRLTGFGDATGREYELSVAVSASRYLIPNLDLGKIAEPVDWISVMTYDYAAGSKIARFNAPLEADKSGAFPNDSVSGSIRLYVDGGVPKSKLVLGIPFYGRAFSGVGLANRGLHRPGESSGALRWGGDQGIALRDLFARRPWENGFGRFWHEVAQVPWMYNPQTRVWISYENSRSIALKAKFARSEGLSGVSIWEITGGTKALFRTIGHRYPCRAPRDG